MEHRMEAFYQLWVLMEKRKEEIDMECKYEQSYQSDCYKSLTRSINSVPNSFVNESLSYLVNMPQRQTSPTRGRTKFTA